MIRVEEPLIAQKYKAIIRGIQHIKDITGAPEHPKFIIGLSGGIDSAINAALLSEAVGKDKVMAVNMPTKYNSEATKGAAAYVADQLDISYGVVPIQKAVDTIVDILNEADLDGSGRKLSEFNEENVQAKIRGTDILSNLAAKYGAIFSNNGNKLEVMLGYATLYGDWGGAIASLADLTKTEEVALARYINAEVFGKEVIPESLLPDKNWRFGDDKIQPSAELKGGGQVDPMKFGYHCAIVSAMTDYKKQTVEDFMHSYLEGTLHTKLEPYVHGLMSDDDVMLDWMERWNVVDPKEFVRDLEWFAKLSQQSVFKRVQSPPIIITSKTAFGFDLREAMLPYHSTRSYQRLVHGDPGTPTDPQYQSIKNNVLAMEKYEPK